MEKLIKLLSFLQSSTLWYDRFQSALIDRNVKERVRRDPWRILIFIFKVRPDIPHFRFIFQFNTHLSYFSYWNFQIDLTSSIQILRITKEERILTQRQKILAIISWNSYMNLFFVCFVSLSLFFFDFLGAKTKIEKGIYINKFLWEKSKISYYWFEALERSFNLCGNLKINSFN